MDNKAFLFPSRRLIIKAPSREEMITSATFFGLTLRLISFRLIPRFTTSHKSARQPRRAFNAR